MVRADREAARFPRAAIATPHVLASVSGLGVLARGGNALDAVLAANLTLGVVAPYLCGYGGDVFAIVWDGALWGYLGSGASPATATPEALRAQGHDEMPMTGPHTVTVPGAVAGWFDLSDRFGTLSFGDLAGDALTLARDGFALTGRSAAFVGAYRALHRDDAAWNAVYGGLERGATMRQPALTRLIGVLAADGPDAYYRGPVAEAVSATLAQRARQGASTAAGEPVGVLTPTDFAAHRGEWVDPIRAVYHDTHVVELPPPTQGVTALEALRILDGLADLRPAAQSSSDAGSRSDDARVAHLQIEAVKLALADRDRYVTDPKRMTVEPGDLLADAYVAQRRTCIDRDRAGSPAFGVPQPAGTAYLCAADEDGMLVSLIQSNFMGFGAGIHVPAWGLNLNNRGASFTFDPARANVLRPESRPMHTLIPAMALREGKPWLVFGSMGGDAQAQVHVQIVERIVDRGEDVQAAIDAPRWRVDPGSWRVHTESRVALEIRDGLTRRGHDVGVVGPYDVGMGHAHAIRVEDHGYSAGTDPRAEGAALGR